MPRQARGEVFDPSQVKMANVMQSWLRRAFHCGQAPAIAGGVDSVVAG